MKDEKTRSPSTVELPGQVCLTSDFTKLVLVIIAIVVVDM